MKGKFRRWSDRRRAERVEREHAQRIIDALLADNRRRLSEPSPIAAADDRDLRLRALLRGLRDVRRMAYEDDAQAVALALDVLIERAEFAPINEDRR